MAQDRPTVLVVDDEPEIRSTLSEYLEMQGYPVLMADGGEAALSILKEHEVKFALLDIRMPGMDGLQTLEQIRLKHPEIIVVMVSGMGMEDLAQRALRMGASDYISKPLRLDYLETVLGMLELLDE